MNCLRVAPHVHSEWSYDASWTLPDIARLFRRLGYDAVLMAEHDRGFDDKRWESYKEACARASARDMLLVPGIEYSDAAGLIHVPVWGCSSFLGEGRPTGELLEEAAAAGAAAVFAHPMRSTAHSRLDPAWAKHLVGVEWWNRKYDGYAPSPDAVRELTAAHGAIPFVAIDFHSPRQLFPLAMSLRLEGERTPEAVCAALRARRSRPRAFGVSALRFTGGRGLRIARAAERTRYRVARLWR